MKYLLLTLIMLTGWLTSSTAPTPSELENKASGPVAICYANVQVALDLDGEANIIPTFIDAGSYDNEGPVSLSVFPDFADCSDVGDPIVVTLTVTDMDGNTNFCTSEVVFEDKTGPVAVCLANRTLTLDASGQASIAPEEIDAGSSDNCPLDITLSQSNFDCDDLGTTTILMYVEDVSGNTNSCWSDITVQDLMAPTAVCFAEITLELGPSGTATLTPSMVDGGSTDNCGIEAYHLSKTHFDCTDGGTTTVLLTVTDKSGNSNVCWTDVTIEDSDCDGVADGCDQCPGGDDSYDNNLDGIPDCLQDLDPGDYSSDWVCDPDPKKFSLQMCHNGNTKCVKVKQIAKKIEQGDFVGPCANCPDAGALIAGPGAKNSESYGGEVTIAPNPNDGRMTMRLPSEDFADHIIIQNMNGQVVMEKAIDHLDVEVQGPFNPGVYIVQFLNEGRFISTSRFVVTK